MAEESYLAVAELLKEEALAGRVSHISAISSQQFLFASFVITFFGASAEQQAWGGIEHLGFRITRIYGCYFWFTAW